jgi:hypothetical protein
MTFVGRRELKSSSSRFACNTKKSLSAHCFSSRAPVQGRKPLTQRMIWRVSGGGKAARNK